MWNRLRVHSVMSERASALPRTLDSTAMCPGHYFVALLPQLTSPEKRSQAKLHLAWLMLQMPLQGPPSAIPLVVEVKVLESVSVQVSVRVSLQVSVQVSVQVL